MTDDDLEFFSDSYIMPGNFIGQNLIGQNFVGSDLTIADFTSANLTSANLTSADLTSANLTSANLTSANLTSANLTNTILTDTILINANLTSAYLLQANLTNANLTNAILTNATLTGVKSGGITSYTDIKLPNGYSIIQGYLIGPNVDLTNADLTNANLTNATLTGVKSGGITSYTDIQLPTGYSIIKGYLIGPFNQFKQFDIAYPASGNIIWSGIFGYDLNTGFINFMEDVNFPGINILKNLGNYGADNVYTTTILPTGTFTGNGTVAFPIPALQDIFQDALEFYFWADNTDPMKNYLLSYKNQDNPENWIDTPTNTVKYTFTTISDFPAPTIAPTPTPTPAPTPANSLPMSAIIGISAAAVLVAAGITTGIVFAVKKNKK